jgi:Fic family protein
LDEIFAMKREEALSKQPIISAVNSLKEEIELMRPLPDEVEKRIMQKLRLDWNYHSNAIEGNSLDYGETMAFLMHGITAKGKPLKDYLDIRGHNEAIDYLMTLVHNNDEIRETDIRALHEIILVEPYEVQAQTPDGKPTKKRINLGVYKTEPNHVETRTGEIHYYTSPQDVPIQMHELMEWYNQAKQDPAVHPLVIASLFHHRFVQIHPFDDGNGRLGRILMNLILLQSGFPPVVIKKPERGNYYLALSQADAGDFKPIIEYIGENMLSSLNIYLKGAKGEDISEQDDLDKKISLFMREVEAAENKLETKRSPETQKAVYENCIRPFLKEIEKTLIKFRSMFLSYEIFRLYIDPNPEGNYTYAAMNIDNYLQVIDSVFLDADFTVWDIVFRFSDFKIEDNMFSIELKVRVEFDNFRYRIYYNISEADDANNVLEASFFINWIEVLSNKYHEFNNLNEFEILSRNIGEETLNYIENKYKKEGLFNLDNNYLNTEWHTFIINNYEGLLSSINELNLTYDGGGNIVFTFGAFKEEQMDMLRRIIKKFLTAFVKKENIRRNLFIYQDLPF